MRQNGPARRWLGLLCLFGVCAPAAGTGAGLDPARLERIGEAVGEAVRAGEIPGAVVIVGRRGAADYCRAFGNRALVPAAEPMTADTVFDVSSLTKVMATTPAVMLLVEEGRLRLDDRVSRYLPEFTGGGKEKITVRQLLTHYSGLRPDFDLSREWSGTAGALRELWGMKTEAEPGTKFVYSDLNFIALGELVRALSGKSLDVFARERVFAPLGMNDTGFLPPKALLGRIAPTEPRRNTLRYLGGREEALDAMVRGEVHDPTAWRMGGVAGHAGVFSSARDLARYARMLLGDGASGDGASGGGAHGGGRLLSPATVEAMTRPQSPAGALPERGFGWDIGSDYASPRGDLLGGGYGHTGFTGTSLWIWPEEGLYVGVLTNRVHPDGGKNINHLRGAIANIVAAALLP